ncbi:MAG: capsid protein [Cressdnaviricota sp.]|nr:MAG: capsid protein [Cressdnaviricota sp.]
MVYQRKTRRTMRKRKTRTVRRRYVKKRYNKRGQKLYNFTRHIDLGLLNADSVNPTLVAINFNLNNLPSSTEFTSLYDSYKINAVKIQFIPQMTENVSLSTVNNPANARFFSVIDYNDSTAPTSINELREYQNCKMTTLLRTHTRYIYKPKILDTSSYTISPWIATSSPSSIYRGIKVALEPMLSTITTSLAFRIEAKYYLSFKMVK